MIALFSHRRKYSLGRVDLVEHQVNDHAGDRHVQPDWESDACDAPVPRKFAPQGAIKGEYHERHDHHRQDRVGCQDREVDRARKAGALKTRGAVIVVIREIRREEKY